MQKSIKLIGNPSYYLEKVAKELDLELDFKDELIYFFKDNKEEICIVKDGVSYSIISENEDYVNHTYKKLKKCKIVTTISVFLVVGFVGFIISSIKGA